MVKKKALKDEEVLEDVEEETVEEETVEEEEAVLAEEIISDGTAIDIDGFVLENPEKIERALNGSTNNKGEMIGGIAKTDGTFDKYALLAEYDRIGGYITKGGDKVKSGSFYDLKAKKPHAVPQVVFVYKVNGETVEVPEGTELPGEVKATRVLADLKKAKKASKKK